MTRLARILYLALLYLGAFVLIPVANAQGPIVLAVAPYGPVDAMEELAAPIAELIRREVGWQVETRYFHSWPGFVDAMREDSLDIVFDDPHMLGWRIKQFGHRPLIRIQGQRDFVVVTRRDSEKVVQIRDIAGLPVCSPPLPELGAVLFMAEYDNPVRYPVLLNSEDSRQRFRDLADGKCQAVVASRAEYLRHNQGSHVNDNRVLAHYGFYPLRGFGVSRRVSERARIRLMNILLSPDGALATRDLRYHFAGGQDFQKSGANDYENLARLFDNFAPLTAQQ